MSQPDPTDYLERHLYNDLRWLLCAAAEWHVQHTINPDDRIVGQHIKLYAMDSAALHARALFEFFTQSTRPNHIGIDLYGLETISSPNYGDRRSNPALGCWSSPLHSHLMHLQDRTVGQRLKSFDGSTMKDLNRMPVDFGHEVVCLWREFIRRLQDQDKDKQLATLAQKALDDAIAASERVVTKGVNPIRWCPDR